MNTMQPKPHMHASNNNLKPGTKPSLKLKGMESIYLQRLEPSAGRRPAPLPKTSRPRFRECTDRVLEDPEQIAEESIVKEHVENLMLDNLTF